MSEEILAPLIAIAILAALALWVPTLHLCNGCVERWRLRSPKAPSATGESVSSGVSPNLTRVA